MVEEEETPWWKRRKKLERFVFDKDNTSLTCSEALLW